MKCENCKHHLKGGPVCGLCYCYDRFEPKDYPKERKPLTNADRIRAMTDEELDRFLGGIQWDVANYCGGVTQEQEYPVPEQRGAWLDWLKAEAKDD